MGGQRLIWDLGRQEAITRLLRIGYVERLSPEGLRALLRALSQDELDALRLELVGEYTLPQGPLEPVLEGMAASDGVSLLDFRYMGLMGQVESYPDEHIEPGESAVAIIVRAICLAKSPREAAALAAPVIYIEPEQVREALLARLSTANGLYVRHALHAIEEPLSDH